jgi:hypothetical protein
MLVVPLPSSTKFHLTLFYRHTGNFMQHSGCTDLGNEGQSHVMTDSQSAIVSWCRALDSFCYCLLMWGTLSDKRMGMWFIIPTGPSLCGRSRARVPRDSCS